MLAASRAYSVDDWQSVLISVIKRFQITTLTVFFSDSHETWHTYSMCQCAKTVE